MTKPKPGQSVFISYNRGDVERAREYQAELETQGFKVWRDQTSVYGSERWPKVLGEAIAGSDVLILLWSTEASNSDFVELEWCTALALKKPIVPILLEDLPLPASLSAINALTPDIPTVTLAGTLKKIARAADSRVRKNRKIAVFSELDSDGKDVSKLAARVHAKADQMSTPKYLALELLRALLIPLLLSLVSGFAATAVIWDNPIKLDANLVLFGAMVVIPTVVLLTLAYVVRRPWARAILVAACIVFIGIMSWFQPRIIAGPVVSIDRPTAVILFYNEAGPDSSASRLIDAMYSLPATMEYRDYTFPVAKFVYRTNPDEDYVRKAIRRNPFIRSVVKVTLKSPDEVEISTEVPALKAWQGLAINNVVGVSERTEFGENDSTTFVFSTKYNVLLSTGMAVSALDYRLSSFTFGIGISRNETESTGWGADRADRVFTTNFEKFGDKLRFAAEISYRDFVVHALGDLAGQCEAFKAVERIAREPGFESFTNLLEGCLPEGELTNRYFSDSLGSEMRSAAKDAFIDAALRGFQSVPADIDTERLLTIPDVATAYGIYQDCGVADFEQDFQAFEELSYLDPKRAMTAQCLLKELRQHGEAFQEGIPEPLVEALGTSFALGMIEEPAGVIGVAGDEWCNDLSDKLRELISPRILTRDARPLIERWNASACAPTESAPRFMKFFTYVDGIDWESEKTKASTAAWTESREIDGHLRNLLLDAVDALTGNSKNSELYKVLLNQFVIDYNASGPCPALLGLGPSLANLDPPLPDAEIILESLCEKPAWALLRPIVRLHSGLAELPVGKTPVLLKQLVSIGAGLEKATGGSEDDMQDAPGWGSELFERLEDYQASLVQLQKYFPEIDATASITLATLESLPAQQQLAYITKQLAKGNSRMLSAYLAEAYLATGEQAVAISTFNDLVGESDSYLRKDYYATRAAELSGEEVCGRIGEYSITTGDFLDYASYASELHKMGVEPWQRNDYLLLLSEAPPLDFWRKSDSFGDRASAVYSQLGHDVLDVARKNAPGVFLRMMVVDEFAASAERDDETGARLREVFSEANYANNLQHLIDETEACQQRR